MEKETQRLTNLTFVQGLWGSARCSVLMHALSQGVWIYSLASMLPSVADLTAFDASGIARSPQVH